MSEKSFKLEMKDSDKKALKVLLALLIFGVFYILVFSNDDDTGKQTPTQAQQEKAKALNGLSDDKKIEKVVNDLLSGQTNGNTKKLKSLELKKTKDGSFEVFAQIRTNQGISQAMTNREIKRSISEVFQAIYTNKLKVTSATASVFAPLQDKYGKQFEGSVYTATLTSTEASKINWQMDKDYLISKIIPSVWQTGIVNPDFRD